VAEDVDHLEIANLAGFWVLGQQLVAEDNRLDGDQALVGVARKRIQR
jgi:hypothetical protein